MKQQKINEEVLKKYLLRAGIVLLVLAVAATIVISVACSKVESVASIFSDEKLTVEQLKEALDGADELAEMMEMTTAEMLGLSGFFVFLLRSSLALQVWLYVLSGLSLAMWFVLSRLVKKPEDFIRAKEGLTRGVSAVSATVKTTVDQATVKCPNCGKVSMGKTKFCGVCGTELPKKVTVEKRGKEIICQKCGEVNLPSAKFCNGCGEKLEEPAPVPENQNCPVCGAENKVEAKFCNRCGEKLEELAPVPENQNCPVCSAENKAGAKFCYNCGTKITE